MPLPLTDNSVLFWMDAAEKFVVKNSSSKVTSVANRINECLILPESVAAQPTWEDNQINGYPTITFNGAQSLYYNLPYNAGSVGARKPLLLIVAAKITSYTSPFTLTALRNGTNTNTNHYISGSTISTPKIATGRVDNDNNSNLGNSVSADTSTHIYTNAYDGTSMKLRIDGVERDNVNVTTAISNFNGTRLFIESSGSVANPATAKIAEVILYTANYGVSLDYTPEQYLKDKYGIL